MDLQFQIYDYREDNLDLEQDDENNNTKLGDYIIHCFGRTLDDKSVYARITDYTPYFYIKFPDITQDILSKTKKLERSEYEKKLLIFFKSKIYNKKHKNMLTEVQIMKSKCAEGFTNNIEFWFARLIFSNSIGMKKYFSYFENNKMDIYFINGIKNHAFKLYEANLPPMFRCFHIRNITGCAWVKCDDYTLIDDEEKESYCDIEIHVDWRKLISFENNVNAPFRILSFDIECNSIDGEFPQASRKGDKIIQIGNTYTYLGKSDPYKQYIACLNDTSDVEGATVECFDNEEQVIKAWLQDVITSDCDIICGYNIFAFDEKYIYDRAKMLGIFDEIIFNSKLKNHRSTFIDREMSSSAMGKNFVKYWEIPGRTSVDLMKCVKDFNLPSNKLDYVASRFIRGEILSWKQEGNILVINTKSTSEIRQYDFIHIEVVKGFISDDVGEKYKVLSLNPKNKTIEIEFDKDLLLELEKAKIGKSGDKAFQIFWSQAKDDIEPKDIFNSFKGTPKDRSVIAKYCLKDCILVGTLMNKLEIVIKNIEMANVCSVPLEFLFTRGQGIKSFSLCMKEFRAQKYIFPVIKPNKLYKCLECEYEYLNKWVCPSCKSASKEEVPSITTKYEGAIVFDPLPIVDYGANSVKDYASLYPSSDMEKNMSHETIVLDDKYDNIDGIKYYNANFREPDGTIQYRRFAKVDEKLGVIPSILQYLLKERKRVKKIMKDEKDPFKYSILDAKQLALKLVANSLYGQLGAPTSQVYMRDIAACITSTGREKLILAKKYDEEQLPWIINSIKYWLQENNEQAIHNLYLKEMIGYADKKNVEELKNNISDFMKEINDKIYNPVVRYGDTDSVFTCYRFREGAKIVEHSKALKIFKKIIKFAPELISPYFNEEEREIFLEIFNAHYSNITDLELPPPPDTKPIPEHHLTVLPLKDRMAQFVKEYMEESYFPWLWTLSELVEINFTHMFDIKLRDWATHLLNKIRIKSQDLYENRRKDILTPCLEIINKYYQNGWRELQQEEINHFVMRFNQGVLLKEASKYFNTVIKDKWVGSFYKKGLIDIIKEFDSDIDPKEFFKVVVDNRNDEIENIIKILKKHIKDYDDTKLETFLPKFMKQIGKKELDDLIGEFIEKYIGLKFSLDVDNHYQKVIDFVTNNMRYEDMSDIEKSNKFTYYWIEPYLSEAKDTLVRRVNIWEGGEAIIDKRAVNYGVKLGIISGEMIKTHLPFPHDCEYEKTFWPFAILTKKRYVGNKYEEDPNKYKFDFMGIVLKRRDNAPIVKEICEGIINYLVNKKDKQGALNFAEKCIQDLFASKYHIKYFLQSRTLKNKESYKNWKSQAHVVLANKMFERNPGSAPQSGDRLEFAVVKVNNPENKKLLQGDRIETPKYIKDNGLEIDYLFYLTNQIMTPALQFLSLVDPNAHIMFDKYIEMYSKPKIRKKITIGDDISKKNKKIPLSKVKLIYIKALDEISEIEDNIKIIIPKIDYSFEKFLNKIYI